MIDGAGLLERAISYALGTVAAVTPGALSRPTPCRDWNLLMLLWHLNDSLATLCDGMTSGHLDLLPPAPLCRSVDPVATFRRLAGELRGTPVDRSTVTVADRPLATIMLAAAGALEIAVHAWDVSQACGQRRPIAPELAAELLTICPFVVTGADRGSLFATQTATTSDCPSDRLIAFLGR